MVEARITCLCSNLILADLKIHLTRGQVVYVSEQQARESQDLQRAFRVHGVDLQYVQRARELRKVQVARPRREVIERGERTPPVLWQPMPSIETPTEDRQDVGVVPPEPPKKRARRKD